MDHGFPARMIVPALPGVHNTKWVGQMTFRSGVMRARYGASPIHLLAHLSCCRWSAWALLHRARLPRGVERRRCGWSAR